MEKIGKIKDILHIFEGDAGKERSVLVKNLYKDLLKEKRFNEVLELENSLRIDFTILNFAINEMFMECSKTGNKGFAEEMYQRFNYRGFTKAFLF